MVEAELVSVIHRETEATHKIHYKGRRAPRFSHGAVDKDPTLVSRADLSYMTLDAAILQFLGSHLYLRLMRFIV